MGAVLPAVPFQRFRKEASVLVQAAEATVLLGVRIKNNLVSAGDLDANAVVGKALGGMEVEDKHQTGPLKYNDLVAFVLERDEGLRRVQPAVLGLTQIHRAVKVVEELVAE